MLLYKKYINKKCCALNLFLESINLEELDKLQLIKVRSDMEKIYINDTTVSYNIFKEDFTESWIFSSTELFIIYVSKNNIKNFLLNDFKNTTFEIYETEDTFIAICTSHMFSELKNTKIELHNYNNRYAILCKLFNNFIILNRNILSVVNKADRYFRLYKKINEKQSPTLYKIKTSIDLIKQLFNIYMNFPPHYIKINNLKKINNTI